MTTSNRTISLGVIVGIIGYVSVAGFYAAFDLLAARGPLYTVDLLGKSIFRGLRDPSVLGLPMHLDTMAIIMYTVLHLVISLVIGVVVTGLIEYADRRPAHARLMLLTIIAGFVVTIVVVGTLSMSIRTVLPWWSIVLANTVAVIVAGTYLVKQRPGMWRRLSPPRT